MHNYLTKWLSILLLQLRDKLVKLEMQFMITGIQIVYKLQVYTKFLFAGYKNGEMEVRQKI